MQKMQNHAYHNFCFEYDAKNIVSEKVCFKSKDNASCIDLFIITNSPNSFQNTSTITTGLSDFHKMVITVLKASFTKSKANVLTFRDLKLFNEEKFKTDLKNSLRITTVSSYHVFEKVFLKVFWRHAPMKNKTIRINHAPYVTKTIRKTIYNQKDWSCRYFKTRSKKKNSSSSNGKEISAVEYTKEEKEILLIILI